MKKIFVASSLFLALIMIGAGCDVSTISSSSTSTSPINREQEEELVKENQAKLTAVVPIPVLTNSLERQNIKKRLETFDDQNKVSYIYLVSYGRVMAFYTIKGKVTSGGKRLTSTEEINKTSGVDCGQNWCEQLNVVESPELDGTYGSSAPYVFFWTTDNAYVQWSGDYMLVDQPLKLATQPELIREIK